MTNLEKLGELINTDILVIGGGIAGHTAAITVKEKAPELEIILAEKATAGKTGPSALVGGRYGGFIPEADDFDEYFRVAVEEADYLCDQDKIGDHLNRGGEVFRNLERWGVQFVKTPEGEYRRPASRGYTSGMLLEGGGVPAMKALNDYAAKIGVKFQNRTMITDLLTSKGNASGAIGFDIRKGSFCIIRSKITVIATGMTRFKTIQPGHRNDTGDGYAMAYRAGANIGGFDATRHNTYGARLEVGPGNNLFVGLGGVFLNAKGERFMHKYHPKLAERAPFVWLSPSFCIERMEGRVPPIHLDMRHFTPDKIETLWKSVPYAMVRFERAGILKNNKFVDLIEYTPEGPRPMPCGIVTGRTYESTNLPGLFAVGDATSQNGASGLSGAAVSGVIAGAAIVARCSEVPTQDVESGQIEALKRAAMAPLERTTGCDPDHVLLAIQEAIHPYSVGIIRHEKRLKKAFGEMEVIEQELIPLLHAYDPHYLMSANEAKNMVLSAKMFLRSALVRKESRNACLREDFPEQDNINWLKYVHLKDENGNMKLWTEDIPIDRYKLKPQKVKFLHPFWQRVKELGYKNKVEE